MSPVEKTVFICYRRTNEPSAPAISQNLTHHGYDAFFDFNSIASGDFERVILGNIKARAHFVVLLTPSALERCGDSGDWLRREIETALDTKRNIVPIMLEGFDFDSPAIGSQLTGKLAGLRRYNALQVPSGYFDAAMEKVRTKYLNVPLDAVLHPTSPSAQQVTENQQEAASAAPAVTANELTAQEWFEKGLNSTEHEEQIRFYAETIRLKPDYANAYNNRARRGWTRATLMVRCKISTRPSASSQTTPPPTTAVGRRGWTSRRSARPTTLPARSKRLWRALTGSEGESEAMWVVRLPPIVDKYQLATIFGSSGSRLGGHLATSP